MCSSRYQYQTNSRYTDKTTKHIGVELKNGSRIGGLVIHNGGRRPFHQELSFLSFCSKGGRYDSGVLRERKSRKIGEIDMDAFAAERIK